MYTPQLRTMNVIQGMVTRSSEMTVPPCKLCHNNDTKQRGNCSHIIYLLNQVHPMRVFFNAAPMAISK